MAVAMAAITLGALVMLPATLEAVSVDWYTLAAANAETIAPVAGAIGATCAHVSERVGREEHVHRDCTTVIAQEFRGKPHHSKSRGRSMTSSARSSL
jgi:hypothetical protein